MLDDIEVEGFSERELINDNDDTNVRSNSVTPNNFSKSPFNIDYHQIVNCKGNRWNNIC